MDAKKLLEEANKGKEKAYVPYSGFRVGAALLTKKGTIYTGCNIENASYSVTICAERTALFKAVSEGEREFEAIAVVSDSSHWSYPCGSCLQVLREFSGDLKIIVGNNKGDYEVKGIHQLFPFPFTPDTME